MPVCALTRYIEWASGDPTAIITWDYATSDGVAYSTFARQDQQVLSEVNQQASWGSWYWSTADVEGVSLLVEQEMARLG
jgi:hypothetical protein